MLKNRTPATAIVAAVLCALGCQQYQARPLDLQGHADAWRGLAPDDAAVRSFLRDLASLERSDSTQWFDPSDGVSLEEAEIVALVFNAEVRLSRLRAGVARATAEHAGLWEDPTFQIDVMRVLSSVSNPWIISPGLAFTVPLSGRLGIERQRASAALRVELGRAAEAEWAVRRELRDAWVLRSAMLLRAQETASLVELLGSLAEQTRHLAEAGEMPRTEAALFAMEHSQRRLEHRRLVIEAEFVELRIKRIMGLAPEAEVELSPSPGFVALASSGSAELSDAEAVAARNLSLVRLRDEYEVAEQALRHEIAGQYPGLTIGPAYESDQGQSRLGVLGGITLPLFNRNRRGIAEAAALRELARAAYEIEYERLIAELAASERQIEAVRLQRDEIEMVVVPLVDRQLADAQRLLRLGEVDAGGGLVLLESLRRAHEVKLSLIQLRHDESLAKIQHMYLLGPEPTRGMQVAPAPSTVEEVIP